MEKYFLLGLKKISGKGLVSCQERLYFLFCFVFSSLFLYIVHVDDDPSEAYIHFVLHVAVFYLKLLFTCVLMSIYLNYRYNNQNNRIKHFQINFWFVLFFSIICLLEASMTGFIMDDSMVEYNYFNFHEREHIINSIILSFLVSLFSYLSVIFIIKEYTLENNGASDRAGRETIDAKLNGIDISVPVCQIEYIKVEENYCYLWTNSDKSEKKYTLRQTLSKVVEDLNDSNIIQIHRSYAVNKYHIDKIYKVAGRVKVKMKSGIVLPVTSIHAHKVTLNN